MIKRTLYFGNPVYLKHRNNQLILEFRDDTLVQKNTAVPLEDIGIIILDHDQITITQSAISSLLMNNAAIISCNDSHMPTGMMLNLSGNSTQTLKHKLQAKASEPLKKQIWQQTIISKITNQAELLGRQGQNEKYLLNLSKNVRSGDSENYEAKAAAYYWKRIFPEFLKFKRDRYGLPPNNILNYGYAILRATMARALVGSGLIPTMGVFHRNQYNDFCLADDIMEPYRPFVDHLVCNIIRSNGDFLELGQTIKKELLRLPAIDVKIDGKKSPLLNAISRTTASLVNCFEQKSRKVIYPEFP